ncbi:MAG TPA: Gp19/Gp15/Gp42 family protein [Acidimicrobiales bacterium]|nr:Gp19/Gp15/Gp42 family protein [Acidimicrobiales bacterium]
MPILASTATTVSNPTAVSDLEARWRPLSTQENTNAQAFLDDAWAQLITLADNVPADLSSGALDPGLVRSVISAAVLRVMKNPDGNRSESIDDYSWTRDSAVSTGTLYFTDNELALMKGVRPKAVALGMANDTDRETYWWPM